MNIWQQIEKMEDFANEKLAEMKEKGESEAWFSFDETTDINIEEMDDSPISSFQAIAYPVDENGTTIMDGGYIQIF